MGKNKYLIFEVSGGLGKHVASTAVAMCIKWVTTSCKLFGYDSHSNIQANLPKDDNLPDSYLFDYNFNGVLHECPFFNLDIFDLDEIMVSINLQ